MVERRGPRPPDKMMGLPVDKRGYIVPFFVAWDEDRPVFEAVDPAKMARCIKEDLCWLCGQRLNKRRAFVIGPMCVVNRVSAEPPSHLSCAEYALRVCPFLTRPMSKRVPMEEGWVAPAGHMIERNPGASLLWVCERGDYDYVRHGDGVLVHLDGDPSSMVPWAKGVPGAWAAFDTSLEEGLPTLDAMLDEEGRALGVLQTAVDRATRVMESHRS